MKKNLGNGLFVPELQSTVYYSRLFEIGIDVASQQTLQSMDDTTRLANNQGSLWNEIFHVSTAMQCISRCARDAVAEVRRLRTIRYNGAKDTCYCFESSFFAWTFDTPMSLTNGSQKQSIWERVNESIASDWFEIKYCRYVRPDTVRYTTSSHAFRVVKRVAFTTRLALSLLLAARTFHGLVQESATTRER